ncbi:retrovirus-related pol polyprotein from transposon TNT 1-94 [Tanacetum coccineum]
MKSIKEGPFHMGTVLRYYYWRTEEHSTRSSIPKDIYSLINHYTDAKDIWENVKMILEGSELTKDDRESQLYDEFEHFCQNKGETIQGYYVRFTKLINDIRNIKMTMPRMQLNSKFVNNMLPEWSRFITEVKLNRGLKESNFDQLYAYLKQHEVHANENRIMMEKFIQPNNDPLALVSIASVQQYPTQSSKSPQPLKEPSPADNFQLDSGSSSTENLIERKVVVQDVRGRYNATNQGRPFQRNNARGNGVAGNVGAQNRGGMTNPGQAKPIKRTGYQLDNDVDGFTREYMALNVDHVFEADECDAFNSDVDEGPTSQTMFMESLTSEDPIYDEAGPSYNSNNLFEVEDHDTFVDHMDEYHEYEMISMSILDEMHEQGVQSRLANKPDMEAPDFNSFFKIKNLEHQIQEKDNVIRNLKVLVANVNDRSCEPYNAKDVTTLIEQNDCVRIELEKIWKPQAKLSDNLYTRPSGFIRKATGKLFADIGYQWRPTGKKLTLGKLDCGSQWRPTGKKFALGEICQLTKLSVKCSTLYANQQVMLWYLDSGCSKHMTGNRSKLMNFVEKFIGSVRFGNDHLGAIMGYGDYVIGDSVISRVYYVEGLGHNLFSVGQFCDSDLEVAFRKHTCFVRDINGTDILKGSRGTNLYTISIDEMMKSSPICLLSKASKSKSWLWHRRLNHLNFGTINDLARKDLVRGLPRLKFEKDHLCSACQLGKSKKFSHRPKSENTNMEVLHTLHMDLCGPMRVQSIKGKKYILVIVDDYSRFTWVKFLRSKDETPEFVTNFLKQIQVGLNKTVRFNRTDNGTEFVNQVMSEYYEGVGIFHQKSVSRTPQQNGIVERRNRTLVEAAHTMMIFSKSPMFLWAEAVATACYTQNRSLIHTLHNKTPYELVHDKKPDRTFFQVFGALCYPTNDSENLGKFQAKADIGIFVGYAPSRKGYRIYNKRTRRLMETIHVTFDEIHQSMAPARMSLGPEPFIMTPGQLKSALAPTDKDLEMLFQPMFDEHLEQSRVNELVPSATEINAQVVPLGTSFSTTIAQDAPSISASSSTSNIHHPVQHQEIAEEPIHKDTPIIHDVLRPSHNLVIGDPGSAQSSSGNVNSVEPNQVNYPPDHLRRWTKDHPLDNIVITPCVFKSLTMSINPQCTFCIVRICFKS